MVDHDLHDPRLLRSVWYERTKTGPVQVFVGTIPPGQRLDQLMIIVTTLVLRHQYKHKLGIGSLDTSSEDTGRQTQAEAVDQTEEEGQEEVPSTSRPEQTPKRGTGTVRQKRRKTSGV